MTISSSYNIDCKFVGACYELTFTSTAIAGKKMIVQATNTGADLGQGQFDLAIPGGGVGIYNGCTAEWGAPSSGWGAQYGGISSNTCSSFPSALQPGCNFRFGDFFQGADNPTVDWKAVTCPKAITDKTGCVRSGETPTGGDDSGSSSSAAPTSSSAAPASSSEAPASSAAPEESSITPVAEPSSSAAPVESSTTPVAETSYSAAPSSSEAAPVASSSAPAPPAYSAPSQAAPSSAAPTYASSSYAVSATYDSASSSTSPASPVGTAPAGGDDKYCHIEYVYEYDL
jgi:hypothetical protein